MKQLTESDIEQMGAGEFVPDANIQKQVRTELHLSQRIVPAAGPMPECVTLDFHMKTEEQAWDELMKIATSGVRRAKIITGASGILKVKFQSWARDSLLSPHIISITPINNGSFDVRFKKH